MKSFQLYFRQVMFSRNSKYVVMLVILFGCTLLTSNRFENLIFTRDKDPRGKGENLGIRDTGGPRLSDTVGHRLSDTGEHRLSDTSGHRLTDTSIHRLINTDGHRLSDRGIRVPRINNIETFKTKGGNYQISIYDYKGAMAKLNREKVAQDDPRLIQIIRDHYILPPSTEDYNLQKPSTRDFSSQNVSTLIDKTLFNNTNEGFFIECGAFDGEFKSTSMYFEREKKWAGLLVEADPMSFARLRYKNRRAYIMNACLSTTPYPTVFEFNARGELGRVLDEAAAKSYINALKPKNPIKVQCFPLYSVLLALNQLHVDFFTLDVEGAELDVLKTLPFDKVDIRTMLVEYDHIEGHLKPLMKFIRKHGYDTVWVDKYDILLKRKDKV